MSNGVILRLCVPCRKLNIVNNNIAFNRGLHTGGALYKKLWERRVYWDLHKRREAQGPEPDRHRSVWPNWNYESELFAFGPRLGESFSKNTLNRVFTHRSYLESREAGAYSEDEQAVIATDGQNKPPPETIQHNAEFIQQGSEFIERTLHACLRHEFPRLPEECIQEVYNHLTSESKLANIASHIGVTDLILTQEFPVSTSTLADSLRAVIGGLRHDSGDQRAQKFLQDFVLTQLIGRDVNELLGVTDPMSVLAGVLALEGRGEPDPRLMYKSGSETLLAVYMVGVYSDKKLVGKGYGETVSIAEEMSARDALRSIFGTTLHRPPTQYSQTLPLTDQHYQPNISLQHYLKAAAKRTSASIQDSQTVKATPTFFETTPATAEEEKSGSNPSQSKKEATPTYEETVHTLNSIV